MQRMQQQRIGTAHAHKGMRKRRARRIQIAGLGYEYNHLTIKMFNSRLARTPRD